MVLYHKRYSMIFLKTLVRFLEVPIDALNADAPVQGKIGFLCFFNGTNLLHILSDGQNDLKFSVLLLLFF